MRLLKELLVYCHNNYLNVTSCDLLSYPAFAGFLIQNTHMARTIKKTTTVVSDPINKEIKVALKALNSLIKELQRKEKEKVLDVEWYRNPFRCTN